MQNKHVLFISYDGLTDPLGQSQILPYLCALSSKGFQISILSVEKKERLEKQKSIIDNIISNNNLNWHYTLYTKKPPIFSTIFDLLKMHRLIKKIHKQTPIQIMHCRSYLPALIALPFKKKYNVKILFDTRGFWADERVDGHVWPQSNIIFKWIYNYFKKKETQFYHTADHIVMLTHAGKNVLLQRPDADKICPITVIPCCADTNFFSARNVHQNEKTLILNQLGISKEKPVMLYVGSVGTWYMLKEMLIQYKYLLEIEPNLIFLFVTTESKDYILNMAKMNQVPDANIIITSANRQQMPMYIDICSFSIFFILPTFSKMASSPTKQGELMAMGKPMLCNNNVGDSALITKKYQAGIVINEFTEEAYRAAAQAILSFQSDASVIRDGAIDFYSLEKGVTDYYKIYTSLISEK